MSLIQREISTEILESSKQYPVVTVLGPRQSGKTTLVKQLFPDKPYVSLENLNERTLAQSDPEGFLKRFPKGAILDEIQRQPSLLSFIQGIVDSKDVKGLFILTGSNQLALHESISQSLAGRTSIFKLFPFSIQELSKDGTKLSYDEYMFNGFYPRIYRDGIKPSRFYGDYVETYLERDVRQIINVKDLSIFQRFLKLCAGRVGQLFNKHNLANEVGVSNHTIEQWLSVLEASFLTIRLQPYFENFGKRVIKAPKLYFIDVGLVSYLLDINDTKQLERDPLRGNIFENLIVMELVKSYLNKGITKSLYFYKDSSNNEVDLIIKNGNDLVPVEIKISQTFNSSFLKGLKYFDSITNKCPKGYIIYTGSQEQQLGKFELVNYSNLSGII